LVRGIERLRDAARGPEQELIESGPSIRVLVPALVDAIRDSETALPETIFKQLGFDISRMHEEGSTVVRDLSGCKS
jgi:hypothetical protein